MLPPALFPRSGSRRARRRTSDELASHTRAHALGYTLAKQSLGRALRHANPCALMDACACVTLLPCGPLHDLSKDPTLYVLHAVGWELVVLATLRFGWIMT